MEHKFSSLGDEAIAFDETVLYFFFFFNYSVFNFFWRDSPFSTIQIRTFPFSANPQQAAFHLRLE
jgi:hypothetical protein